MVRDASDCVIGELEYFLDQCGEVVAGEAVEHAAAVTAGLHQPGQPQPAEMLGHRGARRGHLPSQGAHVLLSAQQVQEVQTGRVGKVSEHVGSHRPPFALSWLLRKTLCCQVIVRAHDCIMCLIGPFWQATVVRAEGRR